MLLYAESVFRLAIGTIFLPAAQNGLFFDQIWGKNTWKAGWFWTDNLIKGPTAGGWKNWGYSGGAEPTAAPRRSEPAWSAVYANPAIKQGGASAWYQGGCAYAYV